MGQAQNNSDVPTVGFAGLKQVYLSSQCWRIMCQGNFLLIILSLLIHDLLWPRFQRDDHHVGQ
jgi:hypothetical protein